MLLQPLRNWLFLFAYGTNILIYAAPQLQSIQLGGGGPRPVSIGSATPGPVYSQQLNFGPPQAQFNPQGALPPHLLRSAQPQQLQPRPNPQQHSGPSPTPLSAFPSPSRFGPSPTPLSAKAPGPIVLKQPGQPIQAQSVEDDEYYYDDDQEQVPVAVSPSPRVTTARPPPPPQVSRVPIQRAPLRIASPQPLLAGPGPQRFVIPAQQPIAQPQPQFIQQQQQPQQQRRLVRPTQEQQQQQSRPVQQQQQQQQQQQVRVQQTRPATPNPVRLGQDSRINGKNRLTTPPPVQTLNRFMRTNDDGSMSWGYENEDGTFKEETLGIDCVVRGKYGYIDPDGNRREYEYQSGNPCDPNKKDQEELDDEEEFEDEKEAAAVAARSKLRPLQLSQPQQQQRIRVALQPQ